MSIEGGSGTPPDGGSRYRADLVDTVNAVPPVLGALLVTAVAGSGPATPALAVSAVAWAPLAVHTSALLRQERAALHITATRGLGAGRRHLLRHELLPAVLPPVTRHALLRLPGTALALSSLAFLGLGAQPPSPEWGRLLAENQPYAERAPWAVIAPAAVLALLGALAVSAGGGVRRPRRRTAEGTLASELSLCTRELVDAKGRPHSRRSACAGRRAVPVSPSC